MYTFQFLKAHGEIKLNVACSIGIVCQVQMIMVAIIFSSESKGLVPFHSFIFPEFVPFHFLAGFHKKLHFHLLAFTHAEYELTYYNFVSKCLNDLRYSKRDFHASGLLNI